MAKKSKAPKTDEYGRPTASIYDPAIDDAIISDHRERKPVSLDYLVEVATSYLDTFERIENAQCQQYDRETIVFLTNRQKTLADELVRLCQNGDGHVGGIEHGAEWKKLRSMAGSAEAVAREIVKGLGGARMPGVEAATCVYLGDGKLQIGNAPPIALETAPGEIIEALVELRAATTD
ncbi:MAG TPA: hypothetical protein VMV10_02230 [Pirellulales bacterium]|nr:hypothetical protein [Pirellulales bacterium]